MSDDHSIVVVGSSAGGIPALKRLVAGFSDELNAAVFIVQHTGPDSPGILPQILQSISVLPVRHAQDNEVIEARRIYVASPDHHLVVALDQILVTRGPKEHFTRPAVDPLFRSAALAYRERVIGVILSGTLDDGTAGLWAISELGGITIVQHPRDAEHSAMPLNALRYVSANHCVPADEIGPLIERLSGQKRTASGGKAMAKGLDVENRIARGERLTADHMLQLGEPSPFTCPECHGSLIQLKNAGIVRFRCYTGHAYSFQSLLEEVDTEVENNLWSAIRSLEESALLLEHFAKHLDEIGAGNGQAALFRKKSSEAEDRTAAIREVVKNYERPSFELSAGDGGENREALGVNREA